MMLNRKRSLVLAAAALFILTAIPASAQLYWGAPGSAGVTDEASDGLYEFSNASMRFKSGQTGTIVARYPVSGVTVEDPGFNTLVFSYGGPGVSMKLMRVLQCSGTVEEVASWGPSTTSEQNTCNNLDVSSHLWDFYGYTYYLEVTLARSTTTPNPQFHHAQLHP